ncbi:MAG: hypothetical protein V1745_04150, partial [Patescibacteria group bacterium]
TMAVPVRAEICCDCYYPDDPKASVCITSAAAGDCANMPGNSTNSDVKSLTCKTSVMDVASATCKAITGGGICGKGPFDERTYKAPVTAATTPASGTGTYKPELGIAIPLLTFTGIPSDGTSVQVPWFAEYVAAVYRYLTAIAVIAAAIMIVYGGFKYIVSSSGAGVQTGKDVIKDAIVGLLLVIGAYTILWTINPATTSFAPLVVPSVKRVTWEQAMSTTFGANAEAPATLAELDMYPSAGGSETTTLPTECPGRSRAYKEDGSFPLKLYDNKQQQRWWYALDCPEQGKKALEQDIINQYLAKQQEYGIPAGIMMAIIRQEGGGCAVQNALKNPGGASSGNYVGKGCTARELPADSCPNAAWPQLKDPSLDCSFINGKGTPCEKICLTYTPDTFKNCGDCKAAKSTNAWPLNGKTIIVPSVQCNKMLPTQKDTFKEIRGGTKACLPFRNSVYKFAYCIGASSYYGASGEVGVLFAEIIERNCLCNPETDADRCVRDKAFEQKLATFLQTQRINRFATTQEDFMVKIDALTEGFLKPGFQNSTNAGQAEQVAPSAQ